MTGDEADTNDPIQNQLADGFPAFRRLIKTRLDAAALNIWDGDLKNHTFRMSLASAFQHLDGVPDNIWETFGGWPQ
ncbi:MAG: hypothetical protein WDZ83_14450 [Rhizobiaceae bacterium]